MSSSKPLLTSDLLTQVNAWCGVNGLQYTDGATTWTPAPIALLPNKLPADSFDSLWKLQPTWNLLVDRISRDRQFLIDTLTPVAAADPFTFRILELFIAQKPEDTLHVPALGVLRCDYMIDEAIDSTTQQTVFTPLQVEVNTISSSFASLSAKVAKFQKRFLTRNGRHPRLQSVAMTQQSDDNSVLSLEQLAEAIVPNESLASIAAGLAAAHKLFMEQYPTASDNIPTAVLFIIQPGERNQGDQRALEQELWDTHGIAAEFRTLAETAAQTKLSYPGATGYGDSNGAHGTGGDAILSDPVSGVTFRPSVVYYRAGYTPDDYDLADAKLKEEGIVDTSSWELRLRLEASTAIKCPTLGYHLVGTKAVQAELCKPGVVERWLSAEEANAVRATFAEQFVLSDLKVEGEIASLATAAMESAIVDGSRWVLKPQREGGGNNFYGAELSEFLKKHRGESILDGYVLMRRIFPSIQQTLFYRRGDSLLTRSLSELGVYGIVLSDGKSLTVSNTAGYLLRTKADGVDEGGVATGYSVLNAVARV